MLSGKKQSVIKEFPWCNRYWKNINRMFTLDSKSDPVTPGLTSLYILGHIDDFSITIIQYSTSFWILYVFLEPAYIESQFIKETLDIESRQKFYFILYSDNQCISKLDKIGIFIDIKSH